MITTSGEQQNGMNKVEAHKQIGSHHDEYVPAGWLDLLQSSFQRP